MNFIRFAIANPIKVTVAVVLVVLFGIISVFRIPIQLTPNVDQPRITITTRWQGASPEEIEEEIIERQEEKLKGVNNLKKMTSNSRQGEGEVVLEFHVGADKDEALRDTIERINQVSNYPLEVERPEVVASDSALASPIAWLIFHGPDDLDASTYRDFVEDHVKPILERVEGVASVDVYGGREREVQVRIDPHKLAARRLTFRDVAEALRGQNRNISAGTIAQGKRDTVFRTIGQYESPEQVMDTVVAYRPGGPVFVRDVVRDPEPDGSRPGVELSYKEPVSFVRNKGRYVLALPVRREPGSNVITVMRGLKEQIEYVNRYVLEPRNEVLRLEQVYDETVYVHSAISLVRNNLLYGGILATIVLLLFLRSASATAVVALCVPISVIGTFLAVALLGRSLNVVMLAGIAFAVGMIVDAAIVLLENIFRHRQLGKQRVPAAIDGTREVWGAVLASTLTTAMVFVPVLFVKEEAGQLFRDIAVAIVVAVTLSMLVAIIVIPTLGARMLGRGSAARNQKGADGRIAHWVAGLVDSINGRRWTKWSTIATLSLLSVVGSVRLMPPSSYLPTGNRNLVFGYVLTPPGYSIEEFRRIGDVVEKGNPNDPCDGLDFSWQTELGSEDEKKLPPVPVRVRDDEMDPTKVEYAMVQPPPIANFFFVSFNNSCFMGATSKDDLRVRPLIGVLEQAAARVPGAFAHIQQTSLFGRVTESDNSIDLEVRGNDLAEVRRTAAILMPELMRHFGGYPRPEPANFDLGRPEVRAVPKRTKAADLGLTAEVLGFVIQACVDGAYVGEYSERGDKIDLTLLVDGTENVMTRELAGIPIYTPAGRVVPLASVVDFVNATAPQEINHIEEQPAVKFNVKVPETMALQAAMDVLEDDIIRPMRENGTINPRVITTLAGNADKLVQTRQALFGKWTGLNASSLGNLIQSRGFLALLVTYLLMAALFESWVYPFVIMFTVPLATMGGFLGLALLHAWTLSNPVVPTQQLDTLTMLGFIMLVGIVVNNGILLVHQTLNFMNERRLAYDRAIVASVRTRVRPIMMTSMTTIFGQLPLVLMPGAGSELYRGIGAVMLGGLLLSTVFTLLLVPAILSACFDIGALVRSLLRRQVQPVPVPRPAMPRPAVPSTSLDETVTMGPEPIATPRSGA